MGKSLGDVEHSKPSGLVEKPSRRVSTTTPKSDLRFLVANATEGEGGYSERQARERSRGSEMKEQGWKGVVRAAHHSSNRGSYSEGRWASICLYC